MSEQQRRRTKYGRPPKNENLTHQFRLFAAAPVKQWLQDEANRQLALSKGISVDRLPRPASPAPFIRDLIANADWQASPADVTHDRRPSILMLVSETMWQSLVARLSPPDFEDVSTLVYAYAVLPVALTAGVNLAMAEQTGSSS